ncbi:MAG TPA: S1C family serine protease [Candidatus Dormibacteraeota bacterium]|jgi:S1-C subfamily serine protease|nr:S1C family serine protease [Candidatus Dormibacteraeota bacterium]
MRLLRLLGLVALVAAVSAGVSTLVVLNRRAPSDTVTRGPQVAAGQSADGPVAAVAKAGPAVVRVETGPAPAAGADAPGGTGVVVDARGYVLTARALVAAASRVAVAIPGGRTLEASVVGSDPLSGTTLLKVEATGLKAATLAPPNSPLLAGSGVVVLAAPPAFQVAVGAVAGTGLSLALDDPAQPGHARVLDDLLQLDVAPRSGQLGAPLLDGAGRMVGMVVALASSPAAGTGAGMSIAASPGSGPSAFGSGAVAAASTAADAPQLWAADMADAEPGLQQLIAQGHVAFPSLGFTYQQLTPDAAADRGVPGGVVVLAVTAGSAAAQAGIVAGDLVTTANGTVLDSGHSLRRLLRALPEHQAVALVLHRAGGDRSVSVPVVLETA